MSTTLKKQLHETLRKYKKSVAELADLIDFGSENYLYKACTPGISGCNYPLEKLIPFLNETKDYRVLKHISSRCGFIVVKIPRSKNFDFRKINEHQKHINDYISSLYDLLDRKITKEECLKKAINTISEMYQVKNSVEQYPQKNFDFEEKI